MRVPHFVRTNAVLAERLCGERYDGAFGALRPLFLGVEHRGQYEPPQRTEKADVGSRTRQVVLTEPLRFRLGHPMDHSNAAGSPRRFAP